MKRSKAESEQGGGGVRVSQLRFTGEQDGPPERELKERLVECFRSVPAVEAAYLARAMYEEQTTVNVVLCVRSQIAPDPMLVQQVCKVFAEMFGAHEHLDIMFLTTEQEADVVRVCAPFFSAPRATRNAAHEATEVTKRDS